MPSGSSASSEAAGEIRSNLHRGGTADRAELTDEERETAVRATEVLGLGVAGVDMLRSDRGPLVIEVNSSPGLEGVETTTGVNVAAPILQYVERSLEEEPSPRARTRDRVGN